ncbi:MAG: tRNA preQ1(34) S-adenosylmethionine ribosyltransferase-isomerase QueA [Actinomycetia bacterium]|nr:tRNA preQ1(34) S-adenosylmethionine ribosyltransferase-isomerase QueA [Actinomycetes bacterium]MCP5033856.1 tRNA preQ1(34) S-adenosylmethionine ribosyltransferase-isomerase QueA [Actinomycetes bacterium]
MSASNLRPRRPPLLSGHPCSTEPVTTDPSPQDLAVGASPAEPAAGEASSDDSAFFDYELPADRIAQEPIEPRDAARLLVDRSPTSRAESGAIGEIEHRRVAELVDLIDPGDVLVVNDTRVAPARLLLTKPTGGKAEVLLLEPTGVARQWQALVKSGRRIRPGTPLDADGEILVVVGEELSEGRRLVEVLADDAMDRVGQVPLPPYIHHQLEDETRYQTVFANELGSVAAPTAGLHLTTDLLDQLRNHGVEVVTIELHVGLGTFRPITAARISDHHMHAERYQVSEEAWATIQAAPRVIAVGTTVVRTLESVAATGSLAGSTELFINRGFDWQVVDTLLTNFHVPRSSLLVLVDAFIGSRWRELYQVALDTGYRFLSFGDAMLIDGRPPGACRHPG